MSAYFIARVNVTDPEKYKDYTSVTPGVVEKYGGKFVVRAGEMVTLEGPELTERIVVIEFPTLERVKEFYNSEEYQQAKKLREGAATTSFIAIEGV
jgi:uncharacterized protein (DUF1330 family)